MASGTYDIITVGGGLGGATLAKVMAEHGARVLVLERELEFKDRVRGEIMSPWGVAEARELGIAELLRNTCAHELRWWDVYLGTDQIGHRDLIATTPQKAPAFTFFHPKMQEVLLHAAAEAGAEVRRGATVRDVQPGTLPLVNLEHQGRVEELCAQLVVGVDGRTSMVRKWAGFDVHHDPDRLLLAGVLFEQMALPPEDAGYWLLNPSLGQAVPLFPQGQGRVRAYFTYQSDAPFRLQGDVALPRLIEESVKTGAPADFYAGVRAVGPLATFNGADTWVEHPYKQGVELAGDAAASNDPSHGQGLSLTLRDVRVLRDRLLSCQDWRAAGDAYAEEHDRHYSVVHKTTNWFVDLFLEPGPEGEARRTRALPLIARDPTRVPDHAISGPDLPLNETVRRRFFGEE